MKLLLLHDCIYTTPITEYFSVILCEGQYCYLILFSPIDCKETIISGLAPIIPFY